MKGGQSPTLDQTAHEVLADAATEAEKKVRAVAGWLTGLAPLSGERVTHIPAEVKRLQGRVGYPAEYRAWSERVRPPQG